MSVPYGMQDRDWVEGWEFCDAPVQLPPEWDATWSRHATEGGYVYRLTAFTTVRGQRFGLANAYTDEVVMAHGGKVVLDEANAAHIEAMRAMGPDTYPWGEVDT